MQHSEDAANPAPAGAVPAGGVRADARRNRERLVAAARAAFIADGFDGVSFNEIARRAGVGPATLYRHFPHREDLLAAVVGDSLDELSSLAAELLTAADPVEALRRWTIALISHISGVRGLAEQIALAVAVPGGPLGSRCAATTEAARRLVDRAQKAERLRPDVTSDDLIQMATAISWVTDHATPPDQLHKGPDRLLDLALHGLVR